MLDFCIIVSSTVAVTEGMFNATCSNISVISWWSVLLVEEIGVPGQWFFSGHF